MGSQNSRNTEIESVSKPPENYENSINFLNSNNSIPSKKKIKSQYNNDYEIGEEENKSIQIPFKWIDGGSVVYVTGTFTNWRNPIILNKIINEFHLILSLTPGVYEYKYIVDGVWKYSNHEQTTDDGHGNINNIVDTNSIERQKQILNKFGSNANNGNYAPNINLNNANTYTEINYQYDKNKNSGDLYEAHTVNDGKAKHLEKNNPQNKQESGLKINEGNFENTANNFNEEAPEIPSHLMCIPFLAEKEEKVSILWKPLMKKNCRIDIERESRIKNVGIFRAIENSNALNPPTHVVINHLGIKGGNRKYYAYSFTQRYKGKYATLKFYTFK